MKIQCSECKDFFGCSNPLIKICNDCIIKKQIKFQLLKNQIKDLQKIKITDKNYDRINELVASIYFILE